jgi:hypothetical protein|tara:strand:- start:435 stop:650 length:216 start_codon:yes stop_codon:yes gene_type:complete
MINDDRYIPVEEKPGLFRDSRTGAIINMNSTGAQQARNARDAHKNKENEIKELKSEVHEIKGILKQLLERL